MQELRHIAFIMDGNGRWAKNRLLGRTLGHKEGLKALEAVVAAALETGIPYLSFYAFSTENWSRPKKEVDSLMKLLRDELPKIAAKMKERDVKLIFAGGINALSEDLRDIIFKAEFDTREGKRAAINICINYGGRKEIVAAANEAIKHGKTINESGFSRLLYTAEMPDPDLLIRTGGERRLSNFMLYQLAYTELYFTDTLWPDFNKSDLAVAINDYNNRSRRFGKI